MLKQQITKKNNKKSKYRFLPKNKKPNINSYFRRNFKIKKLSKKQYLFFSKTYGRKKALLTLKITTPKFYTEQKKK